MCNEAKPKQTQTSIKATLKKLIPPLSFVPPILILYFLDANSFQFTWKGRAPLVIFLWLFALEVIIMWKKLPETSLATKWTKVLPVTIAAILPTTYVLITNLTPLKDGIIETGKFLGAGQYGKWFLTSSWPLSLEYFFFTIFLVFALILIYKTKALKLFQISIFFIGAIATFYMIDTFYPFSSIATLQAMVPLTTSTTTQFLNLFGYRAFVLPNHIYISSLKLYEPMPILIVLDPPAQFQVAIFWPSSGIHSLFIYTFTILLFLKDTALSLKRKTIYVLIGAAGTFLVNVLRIASICIIGLNNGPQTAELFHTYFGEFYFITWIIIFPLTIVYGPRILAWLSLRLKKQWMRIRPQTIKTCT